MIKLQREIAIQDSSFRTSAGQAHGTADRQGGGHTMILKLDSSVRVYHSTGSPNQGSGHHGRTSGK